MNAKAMHKTAHKVADLLKILSHEKRLMILCLLVEGEKTVSTLAEELDMRPSSVSQQLALLRKDGLVRPRREAQSIYYALTRDDVERLMRFLYENHCCNLRVRKNLGSRRAA